MGCFVAVDLSSHAHCQVGCAGVCALRSPLNPHGFVSRPSQRDTQPSTTDSTQGALPRRTRSATGRGVGLWTDPQARSAPRRLQGGLLGAGAPRLSHWPRALSPQSVCVTLPPSVTSNHRGQNMADNYACESGLFCFSYEGGVWGESASWLLPTLGMDS